jgi:Rieske Fe-S protein
LDRKGFLEWLLGTSIGGFLVAVLYPVFSFIVPPESGEATVGAVTLPFGSSDLPDNSGRIFKFGTRPGILVRAPGGELKAFSARCTHLDCTVQYRDDIAHIWCACHNGHFDLKGRNISGPPPTPLEEYDVNIRGDEIVVSRRS